MLNTLIKLIGFHCLILKSTVSFYDRYKFLKRHLCSGSLRTLDAGCGMGELTIYAAKIGNETIGLSYEEANHEKSENYAKILGLSKIKFKFADLRNLDEDIKSLGKFDQIICFETIEHIFNDSNLVSDIASLLNKNGKIILTTPYKYHVPRIGDNVSDIEDGGHVRYGYTHEEIEDIFNRNGLKVYTKEYISGIISQSIDRILGHLNYYNYPLAWAITFPLRILFILDSLLTRIFNFPHLSIGVVGIRDGNDIIKYN